MKQASVFEIAAARCWNLLNEGKTFTPAFTAGAFLLYHVADWGDGSFWSSAFISLLGLLPMFAVYYIFDFPLFLRSYLWIPLVAYMFVWPSPPLSLIGLASGLYFLFAGFGRGAVYHRLRLRSVLLSWKLALKNSGPTSGNALEQLPKALLLLMLWDRHRETIAAGQADFGSWLTLLNFTLAAAVYGWALHKHLFDWRPAEAWGLTRRLLPPNDTPLTDRVVAIVVDGMRKDALAAAETPFMDYLRKNGTEYTRMETVYPARTAVSLASMLTGANPREHGVTSGAVWRRGLRVESIFDSLRKLGKKGRLIGTSDLTVPMGADVEVVAARGNDDMTDRRVIERAKRIMTELQPDLLVVQLPGAGQTGRSLGVRHRGYAQKIEEADELIEYFVHWLKNKGLLTRTTLLICADYGEADGIDAGDRFVPFFLFGPRIRKGMKIGERHSLVSVAPTISYLLGAPYPSHSRGEVLLGALELEYGSKYAQAGRGTRQTKQSAAVEQAQMANGHTVDEPAFHSADERMGQEEKTSERETHAEYAEYAEEAEAEAAASAEPAFGAEFEPMPEPEPESAPEPGPEQESAEPEKAAQPNEPAPVKQPADFVSAPGWKRPRDDYVPRKGSTRLRE